MRNATRVCSGLLLIIASLLVSCRRQPSTIWYDNACSPPCWRQITPGQTTEQEVLEILPTWKDIYHSTIKHYPEIPALGGGKGEWARTVWEFTTENTYGELYYREGKVLVISLSLDAFLTYSKALEKLGTPDKILARVLWGDYPYLIVDILYLERGVIVTGEKGNFLSPFKLSEEDRIALNPNDRVSIVEYFDPSLFEIIMTEGPSGYWESERLKEALQPWTGFGEINYVRDGR